MGDTLRLDNGALPAQATRCSPARLPGPFDFSLCTAFTATGGSLKHGSEVYSSGSTSFAVWN